MRTKLVVLAVAAMLALGMGSVVAAMDAPATDATSDDALPANYTVSVTNPDEVNDDAVTRAIETAWADEDVRSYFNSDAAVHFDVWASELDANVIHVDVAPMDVPDETRVVAEVDSEDWSVESTDEPVSLNATNTTSIDTSDYDVVVTDGHEDAGGDGNDSQADVGICQVGVDSPCNSASQFQVDDGSIERGDDGTITVEFEDG